MTEFEKEALQLLAQIRDAVEKASEDAAWLRSRLERVDQFQRQMRDMSRY